MNIELFKKHSNEFFTFLDVEKNVSYHTLRAYKADIKQLIDFWERIQAQEKTVRLPFTHVMRRFVVSLFYKKMKKTTLARKLSCLRSLKNFLKTINVNLSLNFKSPRLDKILPITLTVDEIFYLLDTLQTTELPSRFPLRDKAILELMYATGIRCSELTMIKISDINFSEKTIRILGKGKKERIVLFGSKAHKSICNYLDHERPQLSIKHNSTYLFLNYQGSRITPRSVQRIFEMFRKFLKVERQLTPHKMRHSFATHLLAQGVDLRVIQELLGHRTINTTEIYTKVTNSQLARMFDEKHPLNAMNHLMKTQR